MKVWANWLLLPALLCTLPATGKDRPIDRRVVVKFIGAFSDIASSPSSGDCDGYRLRLWQFPSGRLTGTFQRDDGPCNRPPVPIYDVFLSKDGHSFSFKAPSPEFTQMVEVLEFRGNLAQKNIVGFLRVYAPSVSAPHRWNKSERQMTLTREEASDKRKP